MSSSFFEQTRSESKLHRKVNEQTSLSFQVLYAHAELLSRTMPWTINSGSRSCGLIMSHDMLLWRFVKSSNLMTTSSFELLAEKTFQNDNPEGFLMAVFHAMKCVSRWQKSSKWKHPMWKLLSVSRNELICNMPPIIQKTFGFSVTTFEEFRSRSQSNTWFWSSKLLRGLHDVRIYEK